MQKTSLTRGVWGSGEVAGQEEDGLSTNVSENRVETGDRRREGKRGRSSSTHSGQAGGREVMSWTSAFRRPDEAEETWRTWLSWVSLGVGWGWMVRYERDEGRSLVGRGSTMKSNLDNPLTPVSGPLLT